MVQITRLLLGIPHGDKRASGTRPKEQSRLVASVIRTRTTVPIVGPDKLVLKYGV